MSERILSKKRFESWVCAGDLKKETCPLVYGQVRTKKKPEN